MQRALARLAGDLHTGRALGEVGCCKQFGVDEMDEMDEMQQRMDHAGFMIRHPWNSKGYLPTISIFNPWYGSMKRITMKAVREVPRKLRTHSNMASETPKGGSWYFAYGSNMRLSTFIGRGISPLAQAAVQVDTHYLNFDIFGVPYGEPSFASIDEISPDERLSVSVFLSAPGGHPEEPLTVPPVVGVAYLISDADRHRLLVCEGSGIAYECIEVEGRKIAPAEGQEAEAITAWALKARHPVRPNGIPSARYMVSRSLSVSSELFD